MDAADALLALALASRDEETLQYLVDSGHEASADRWAELAADRGDTDLLSRLADEGSEVAERLLSAARPPHG